MLELNNLLRAVCCAMFAMALACSSDPATARRPSGASMAGESGAAGQGGASGTSGTGGGASGAGATGAGSGGTSGAGAIGGTSAGGDDGLTVHVEDEARLAVDIVTVACAGECATVTAVASGGQPDYHFTWEDGSTSATRMLCPSADSMHEVTVTDTAREDEEFGHAMETARASVSAKVLGCEPPPEPAPDAGAGSECEDDSDCGVGQTCFEGICVGEGGLRFSLTWNEDTDFDLFVRMPDRTEISYIVKSAGGGMLDVDDCFESCRIPGGPHVENIFFGEDPPHGTYTYWIVNSGAVTPDDYRLEVSSGGMVQATQTGSIAAFTPASERYTFDY